MSNKSQIVFFLFLFLFFSLVVIFIPRIVKQIFFSLLKEKIFSIHFQFKTTPQIKTPIKKKDQKNQTKNYNNQLI